MIDRKKLLPAIVFCFVLFVAGVLEIAFGQTHKPRPRRAGIEQLADLSTSLAKTNDRFTDAVISTQQAGALTVEQAKTVLLGNIATAQAGQQMANQLAAASKCAIDTAGKNATPAKLDAAGRKCLAISRVALGTELGTIRGSIAKVRISLAAVKTAEKRSALDRMLASIATIAGKIADELQEQGVTP